MKINKLQRKGYEVTLELEEEFSEVEKETAHVFNDVVKTAKIPGFRPGKAPRNIYEKYYGKSTLLEKASTRVMNKAYTAAIDEKKLMPVDFPKKVDVKTFEENKPFVFELIVDVKPEFKLGKYKGLKLSRKKVEISDADVQKELEKARDNMASFNALPADASIQKDDIVAYDIEAKSGDEILAGLTREKAGTKVGSNDIHEKFDEALLGLSVGAEKSIEISFDDKANLEELKNKTVRFKFKIVEIKRKELPALDDAFAKRISVKETLSELKTLIKENLTLQKEQDVKSDFENHLLLELVKETEIELPEVMVQKELSRVKQQISSQLSRSQLSLEQYLSFTGKSMADWEKENRPQAENNIKFELILEAIAETEEIKPSEDEVKAEVQKLIESFPEESRKELDFDKVLNAQRENISYHLKNRKTIEYVTAQAKITESKEE